ncbi:SLC25A29 [Bugula neritina]|uniref:SLC25A29 n=1 Tax=Bugula neritina TaxID=10212 RepID=A0A7J7KB09_BUGNE|nr:SLC25A29 [Bugula neritina]
MELVKTQMQMQGVGDTSYRKRMYSSSYDTLRQLYRAKGARAMYRGMSITAARELPSFGVYFVTYEYLCRQFRREGEGFCPTWALLTAGGLAGCASWLNCYPLDVVKSRYQADGQWQKGQLVYSYSGYRDCLRRLIADNGYAGLFRGFLTTLVRAFPTNGATFAVVSLSLRYFRPVTAR